ncbi:hypothetical protein Tco_1156056 [Tanacetum coccineum]
MIRLRATNVWSPFLTSHLPPPIILSHTSESMAIMRAAAPSTYSLAPPSGTPPFLHIPLPTSSPPLLLPSIDHRAEIPEVSEQTIVLLLPWMQRLGVIQREMFVIVESTEDYCIGTSDRYYSLTSSRPRSTGTSCGDTKTDEYTTYIGVADVLVEHEATRSRNGEDSHDSGMGGRRQAPLARECTYPDFMKCKTQYFKGTEGVVELTQ